MENSNVAFHNTHRYLVVKMFTGSK